MKDIMPMLKSMIINIITIVISIIIVMFLFKFYIREDISNIYDVFNNFQINSHSISPKALTIYKPKISLGSHTFSADKIVVDGFMLTNNNNSALGKQVK